MERTFAAGDVAAHRDGDGGELSMSAQIAVQAGRQAGANAARLVDGAPLEAVRLSHRGWVLDLGAGHGVAQLGPLSLGAAPFDRLAPLLHTAIDLKHLQEIGGLAAMLAFRPGAPRRVASDDPADVLDQLDVADPAASDDQSPPDSSSASPS
jgi:NADH dehydrogenase FAD-containing subunit